MFDYESEPDEGYVRGTHGGWKFLPQTSCTEVAKQQKSDPAEAGQRPVLDAVGNARPPQEPSSGVDMELVLLVVGAIGMISSALIGARGIGMPFGAGSPYIETCVGGVILSTVVYLVSLFFGCRAPSRNLDSEM